MASLVTSIQGFGLSNPTTGSADTTGATLLVAVVSYAGTITSFTDSKSNTWTALTEYSSVTSEVRMYYVNSNTPTVGSGHTFTANGTSIAGVVDVLAFDGTVASPFDTENGNAAGSASSVSTGSVTPANDGSILVAGVATTQAWTTLSIDSSFSITNSRNFAGGSNYGGAAAYLIQGTAAAINPTWSFGATISSSVGAIAAFEATAADTFIPKVMMF